MRLLEQYARRPGLLVVTYHRIGTPATNLFYDPVYSATPEAFEAEVRYLRDHFRLVGLEEVLAQADAGFRFTEPTAILTFDDGYRDNFEVALPTLRTLGVSATFFLATGFIGRSRLTWWDRIAYVVRKCRRDSLDLEIPKSESIDLEKTARSDAVWTVIRAFMNDPGVDERAFMSHLEERAEVAVNVEALGSGLFMTWGDVRALAAAGMTIGSHTHNHRMLARLSEAEQRHELAESKRVLEKELGRSIAALAYPYGDPGTFTDQTKHLAREVGYRLAFSAHRRINRPGKTEAFEISRMGVGLADSPGLIRARAVSFSVWGSSML